MVAPLCALHASEEVNKDSAHFYAERFKAMSKRISRHKWQVIETEASHRPHGKVHELADEAKRHSIIVVGISSTNLTLELDDKWKLFCRSAEPAKLAGGWNTTCKASASRLS